MLKPIFISVFSLFFLASNCDAQVDLAVAVKPGISTIHSSSTLNSQHYQFSGEIGLRLNIEVNSVFNISSGIMYNRVEALEKNALTFTDDNGQPIGEQPIRYFKHVNYLGFPVLLGININNVNLKIGAQTLILSSGTSEIDSEPFTFQNQTFELNEKEKLPLDTYDIGLVGEFRYRINQKLSLNSSYYFGLNNIATPQNLNSWKIRQILLGIEIRLFENVFNSNKE